RRKLYFAMPSSSAVKLAVDSEHSLAREREAAVALAGRGKEGVAERGGHADRPDLAEPAQRLAGLQELRDELGHIRQRRHPEAVEIQLARATLIERDGGIERDRKPPHHAALDHRDAVDAVEDAPGIADRDDLVQLDGTADERQLDN